MENRTEFVELSGRGIWIVHFDYHGNYVPENNTVYAVNIASPRSNPISTSNLGWNLTSCKAYEWFINLNDASRFIEELMFQPTMEF